MSSRATRLFITILIAALSAVALGSSGAVAGISRPTPTAAALAPTYQPPSETNYVAITPCRIVDTRAGTGVNGTRFTSTETRTYYVGGTFGFSQQGGASGGCGIPVGAVAIAANFLVVAPSKGGRINAWPNGVTEPTATTYYYGAHTGSAGTTVTINPSSAYALKVRDYSATTDLVIDVNGYYVKPLSVMITPSGGLYAGSSRAVSSSRTSEGVYRVTFDRDVHNCTVLATAYISAYYASADSYSYAGTNEVQVRVFDAAGSSVDQYVYVVAIC